MIDIVTGVAYDVRYWAEKRANNEHLAGWCAIASAELHRRLDAMGIKAELHVWTCHIDGSTSHVFLVVDDHVVDVTATQFHKLRDYPVFIEHRREAERFHFYRSVAQYNTCDELIKYQRKAQWPCNQVAYSKSTCIVDRVVA